MHITLTLRLCLCLEKHTKPRNYLVLSEKQPILQHIAKTLEDGEAFSSYEIDKQGFSMARI